MVYYDVSTQSKYYEVMEHPGYIGEWQNVLLALISYY